MAAATYAIRARVSDKESPTIRRGKDNGGAGWIGSKAGIRNDFVQLDASGYIDEAAAAGAAVSTVRVALLQDDVASSVAADSSDALAVGYRVCSDETEITLALVTNSSTLVSAANTNINDLVGIYRRTDGTWAWDTNATTHAEVVRVDVANGLVTCRLLPTYRLL